MALCPLRSIEVGNFKSIAHGKVDFKPLTVLVGKNSAGKSSLLQALRFLSQTAATSKSDIEIPLNGTKLKLGNFDDIRTVGAEGPVSLQASLVTNTSNTSDSSSEGPEATLKLEVEPPEARPERGYAHLSVNELEYLEIPDTIALKCTETWFSAVWDLVLDMWVREAIHEIDFNYSHFNLESDQKWYEISANNLEWEFDPEWESKFAPLAEEWVKWLTRKSEPVKESERSELLRQAHVADIRSTLEEEHPISIADLMNGIYAAISNVDDDVLRSSLILDINFYHQGTEYSKDLFDLLPEGRILDGFFDKVMTVSDVSKRELFSSIVGHNISALIYKPYESEYTRSRYMSSLSRLLYQDYSSDAIALISLEGATDPSHDVDLEARLRVIEDRVFRYPDHDIAAMALEMIRIGELSYVPNHEISINKSWRKHDPIYDDLPQIWPWTDLSKSALAFVQEIMDDEWTQDPLLQRQFNLAESEKDRWRVTNLLRDRVHYLGPLRQEPRPFFDIDDDGRPDVGSAGQHLARVLQWHGTKTVDVPQLGKADLVEGLQYWLRELEMIDDVTVEARGRAGVSIEVRPPDLDHQVDLTSVGVGVSQVLPVLAVCLLADPGDIVLLEQPELHLHPALQMRLADFLLACIESGRQIIVETHSEHLVNRLRRRVAEDDANNTAELVRIVFAERDAEGHTTFRSSDINPLGGLSQDWPDGFLDLGARDAQKLLQAGLAKQRRLNTP